MDSDRMEWDKVVDVVVIGYGSAGSVAAITAHDAGAQVMILEKMPEEGGTSRSSGGRIRIIDDPEKAVDYLYRLCEETTPKDMLKVYCNEGQDIPDWVESMGGQLELSRTPTDWYPILNDPLIEGSESIPYERWRVVGPEGAMPEDADVGGGLNFFGLLLPNVEKRGIEVMLNTPAKKLITKNNEKEVIGVIVEHEGKPIRVKARRAVVLCSGGFSSNPEMLKNHVGQGYYLAYCNPGNTGDGIKMAQDVGADLWHMTAIVAGFAYKFPEYDYPIRSQFSAPSYIYVDQKGKRFMNETGIDSHLMWTQVFYWDVRTLTYPRVPSFVILDDDTFQAAPIATTVRGKIGDVYQWSQDNIPELERGWITKADSVSELAEKLGLHPATIEETVAKYNSFSATGYDPDFGRSLQTLGPIIRPPFYSVRVWPTLLNTQGGPKRNTKAEVLDVYGKPIPRLYSNGELGSLWNRLYIGAGNFRENIVFGRIAGKNAAAQQPWDS